MKEPVTILGRTVDEIETAFRCVHEAAQQEVLSTVTSPLFCTIIIPRRIVLSTLWTGWLHYPGVPILSSVTSAYPPHAILNAHDLMKRGGIAGPAGSELLHSLLELHGHPCKGAITAKGHFISVFGSGNPLCNEAVATLAAWLLGWLTTRERAQVASENIFISQFGQNLVGETRFVVRS